MAHLRRTVILLKQLSHLVVWLLGWTYVYVKRRAFMTLLAIFTVMFMLALVQWGIVCINMQSWWHVHRVCLEYSQHAVAGDMCASMCLHGDIESLSCQKFYMGKEAVFAASVKSSNIIFKSPKKSTASGAETLYWVDDNSLIHYPNDAEFENMITNNVKIKFNMTISDALAKNMSKFHYGIQNHTNDRFIEMANLWFLLQDNEYLAMILYEKYNMFPKLIGSCGPFYAMQQLTTITGLSHLFSLDHSREEWERRVRIAIMILDLLHNLEYSVPEPLHICDVKMNHFGMTPNFDKVKYLDLDTVHPRSVVNKIIGDSSECADHSDCGYFDCRSFCNQVKKKCLHPIANNNLQIVCEKIFLGWTASGRVLVPGLLLGPHTPRALSNILKICANPANERGPVRSPASSDVGRTIYRILINLKAP